MVVKFSENCTDEEKREVCICLSQLFELAKNLGLQAPYHKIEKTLGYPIPLVFHWRKNAIWPEHDGKTGGKHSSKPANSKVRPKSASFDTRTAGGVTKGQTGASYKRYSYPSSSYESKSSLPVTPQPSHRSALPNPCQNSHPPGPPWPRSEAEKFIVISHAVHSKENSQTGKREFYFDIKADNGYEYHLYVSRHNIPWETAKHVAGETSTTVFTGIITWIEQKTETVYKCNLMRKDVTWHEGDRQYVFNMKTGNQDP